MSNRDPYRLEYTSHLSFLHCARGMLFSRSRLWFIQIEEQILLL